MANGAADEVVGASSLEGNGGGATAVGGDGVSSRAAAVVARAHLVNCVPASVVEHCKIMESSVSAISFNPFIVLTGRG